MSSKPILYYHILSPPSRAVLMTAAELGIELELKVINLLEFEHKSEEFIKINPQHTVPTIDDNGVVIADSHAICAYLSEKYGKTDRLYPKDLAKRALVDSRLHFDSGHMFARLRFLYEPILYYKSKDMSDEKIKYIQDVWDIIERFLEKTPYLCGDDLTIADLCLVASVTSVNSIAPMDPEKHGKIFKWIERLAQLPYYEEKNAKGAEGLQEGVRQLHQKNLTL